MATSRYSRHRPIPVCTNTSVVRKKKGDNRKDTAKIAEITNGGNGLARGAPEPEGRNARNCRAAVSGTLGPGVRWFARGPVYLDQVTRAARKGGYAVVVWLAVRAREGSTNGAPATVAWIAKNTGLGDRAVRKAAAALIEIGMLKRSGKKLSSE
jgi:hypothetical protein